MFFFLLLLPSSSSSLPVIRKNLYWYRDRSGLPRGPLTNDLLKKCWITGIIDEHTLMWGNGCGGRAGYQPRVTHVIIVRQNTVQLMARPVRSVCNQS
jgi:hypothetical protein